MSLSPPVHKRKRLRILQMTQAGLKFFLLIMFSGMNLCSMSLLVTSCVSCQRVSRNGTEESGSWQSQSITLVGQNIGDEDNEASDDDIIG